MKYTDYDIVFQEIPGETTLAINISNCPFRCKGCHSPQLQEDIGEELTIDVICNLVDKYPDITCISIMGGDTNPKEVEELLVGYTAYMAFNKPNNYCPPHLAWYSGRDELPPDHKFDWRWFTYIKLGKYQEDKGGLNNPTTNQRLYKVCKDNVSEFYLKDITYKFWKNDTDM